MEQNRIPGGKCGKCGSNFLAGEAVEVNAELRSCHVECPTDQESLFSNMKNPIGISEDLAKEFVEWALYYSIFSGQHICDRLANEFEKQLKTKTEEVKKEN